MLKKIDPLSALPAKAGVGYKPIHFDGIGQDPGPVAWFEIHAENYMGDGGPPHAQLRALRENYPISCHGVGLSIGSEGPLDTDHLARLKHLIGWLEPAMFSEHLAWSTHDDIFYNDLLPAPYTDETLRRVTEHIDQMQNYLGRQILIENPSTYIAFANSTWLEVDFMAELAKTTGCGLLFDVNNVFVSATNHGYSPQEYIRAYPLDRVQEIHLAGHAIDKDDHERPLLIDAHDRRVCSDVWELYKLSLSLTGPLPSLIEWDAEIPAWPVLAAEAAIADKILGSNDVPSRPPTDLGTNRNTDHNGQHSHVH